jgi:hypothetical protein
VIQLDSTGGTKVVYSEGLRSIRFLSDCGYVITIHDSPLYSYVPCLTADLFCPPINSRSSIATLSLKSQIIPVFDAPVPRSSPPRSEVATRPRLSFKIWKVAPRYEPASVSIEEIHARLNHFPLPAVQRLIRDKSTDGVPDRAVGAEAHDESCGDCVDWKLSRAPHTKPPHGLNGPAPSSRTYMARHRYAAARAPTTG